MKIKLTGVDYFQSKKSGTTLMRICGLDTEQPKNGGVGVLTQNLIGSADIKITNDMINKIFAVCQNNGFVTELIEVK